MIILNLPFPPSVNTLYRAFKGRNIKSAKGRVFMKEAVLAIKQQDVCEKRSWRASVTVTLFPPCRRKRDLDNYSKGLLDAITEAGVWADDSQIDALTILRGSVEKGGRCEVVIEWFDNE